MTYKLNDDQLMLGDEDDTWIAYLNIIDGSYNQVKNSKSTLQSYFQQNGFSATAAEVKTINGVECVTIELSNGVESAIAGYTKLNSMKVAYFVVANLNYTIDYDSLKKITPIISSAEYNNSTFNIELPNKFSFNMNEISNFAK